MKLSWLFKRIWLATLLLSISCGAHARDLTFAPLPMEQQMTILRQVAPMLFYVEKHLGQPVRIRNYDNYGDILDNFREKNLDLAFLGPLPYVELKAQYPDAEPVVRFLDSQGNDSYTCSLVSFLESDLDSIQSLAGKKIALTQSHSTCGFYYLSTILQRVGLLLDQVKFQYTGSHQESALAVVRGEFDAGTLKTSIGEKYAHLGLRFLDQSGPLPGFLLVANRQTMSNEQIEAVRNALLLLRPLESEADRKMTMDWGNDFRYGSSRVDDSDYDVIREKLTGVTIPTHGNF